MKDVASLVLSPVRAREIMGRNFFGVEEAIKYFSVNLVSLTNQQLAALSEVPYSEATLREVKDTHILVAVFPLSILEIRGRVERGLFCIYRDAWYNNQSFARECGEASWQLVRKTPVENSTSKDWQRQQELLGNDEEVPTARVMVYTIIGHFLATGEQLFKHIYTRTSSMAYGCRINIAFDLRSLYIYYGWDSCRGDVLGISSARKSP